MGQKVLVTGAGGYLGSWIVKKLLEQGYDVAGTVRDLRDKEKYSHLFLLKEEYRGKFEIFEADLVKPGSFAKAMTDCYGVIHTASPFFISKPKDVQRDMIRPALSGTENVLNQVNETASVRKVVLTSSVVACATDNIEYSQKALDENWWNETASPSYQPYPYSKTVAEERAWEMFREQSRWQLSVINPAFILGPSLSTRIDSTSNSFIHGALTGQFKLGTPQLYFGIVDVRDVAEAHILAMEKGEGRHIACSEVRSALEMVKTMESKYGKKLPLNSKPIPKWLFYILGPTLGMSWKYIRKNYAIPIKIDNSKIINSLGMKFRTPEETILDHAEKLLEQI
jgi:nucleoside-diphosphate-sugar epimerase